MKRRRPATPLPSLRLLGTVTAVSDQAVTVAVDYVVCVTAEAPRYFSDDVQTTCFFCGRAIHHRPQVPLEAKKICLFCATSLAEEAA